jgi:hypothetical protein
VFALKDQVDTIQKHYDRLLADCIANDQIMRIWVQRVEKDPPEKTTKHFLFCFFLQDIGCRI